MGDSPVPHSLCREELLTGCQDAGSITLGQYLQQLARHRNFLWFVGMDLVQVWEQHPLQPPTDSQDVPHSGEQAP